MLKLKTTKLFYAIKKTDDGFAYTRSRNDDITEDKTIYSSSALCEISAWSLDTPSAILKDMKAIGLTEFDALKAKMYMGVQ